MKSELMPEIPTTSDSWQFVVDSTDEEREALMVDFWNSHLRLLEKYEKIQPGISEKVFLLFEKSAHESNQVLQEHFEKVTLPKLKRRAFIDGVLGRRVMLPWKIED